MTAPKDMDELRDFGRTRMGNAFLEDDSRPDVPPWFDPERFECGQQFFRSHALSIIFSYLCALYVGFTVDALADAVAFTGESSAPGTARRRYFDTMAHIYSWHVGDFVRDPLSLGYGSIRYVRKWHDRVRTRLIEKRPPATDESIFVSQYDTAVVQAGFIAPIALYGPYLGINCDPKRLESYVYFWRVVGYVLGLDDRANVCGDDAQLVRRFGKAIESEIIVPGLLNPSKNFDTFSNALVDGLKAIWPWLTKDLIRGFVYPRFGLPIPLGISFRERVTLFLLRAHFTLMYYVPLYASFWNERVFKTLSTLLPSY